MGLGEISLGEMGLGEMGQNRVVHRCTDGSEIRWAAGVRTPVGRLATTNFITTRGSDMGG